ncbi:MAG: hypothetical protein GY944_12950 [bacterium]|nr:hypothetical protein [bacterium]
MKQLEIPIVRARLRAEDKHGAGEQTTSWSALPDESRAEVVKHLAEMLRAHFERSALGEASDE